MSTNKVRDPQFEQALEDWADTVIVGWVTRMWGLGMFDKPENTGLLARSLQHNIIWEAARDDDRVEFLERIRFAFHFYGKMVDYGLGRSTDIKDRFEGGRDTGSNKRKRKKWIQEPWVDARPALKKILCAKVGERIMIMLRHSYEGTTDTVFKTKQV